MHAQPGSGLLSPTLTPQQATLVGAPLGEPQSLFLAGPAGCGKTTAGVARLLRLLRGGVAADSVLVLVPQRTLGQVYRQALGGPGAPAGGQVDVLTIGGLAQRSVELYWPLVAGPAGFAHPDRPPVFLTLETAQYFMDRLIAPYLEQGAFGEVTLSRQRLISQILDGLNKAAVASFSYLEIGARLGQAWVGESSRLRVYGQVQACATDFRRFCLAHNLLDFSLQVEVFVTRVLALPEAAEALRARYRHLLVDNAEEDVPVAHDLVADWLDGCDSAWIICDDGGGLRSYLGADPQSALALRTRCQAEACLDEPLTNGPPLLALAAGLARALGFGDEGAKAPTTNVGDEFADVRSARFSAPSGAKAPTTNVGDGLADVRSARFSAPSGAKAPTTNVGDESADVRSARFSAPSGAKAPTTNVGDGLADVRGAKAPTTNVGDGLADVRSARFSAPSGAKAPTTNVGDGLADVRGAKAPTTNVGDEFADVRGAKAPTTNVGDGLADVRSARFSAPSGAKAPTTNVGDGLADVRSARFSAPSGAKAPTTNVGDEFADVRSARFSAPSGAKAPTTNVGDEFADVRSARFSAPSGAKAPTTNVGDEFADVRSARFSAPSGAKAPTTNVGDGLADVRGAKAPTTNVGDGLADVRGAKAPTTNVGDEFADVRSARFSAPSGAKAPTTNVGDGLADVRSARFSAPSGAKAPTTNVGDEFADVRSARFSAPSGAKAPTTNLGDEFADVRSARFSAPSGAKAPTTNVGDEFADVRSARFSAPSGAKAPTTNVGDESADVRGAKAPTTNVGDEFADACGAKAPTTNVGDPRACLVLVHETFHTEAIRAVAGQVSLLVHEQGVPAGQIALLAPFMTDALRFALAQALERNEVPSYSRRPSRALADEPAARCLLTLAKLAHPAWGLVPPRTDVAHALLAAIEGLDLVRAWHLTAIAYRPRGTRQADSPGPALAPFEQIRAEEQLKITYLLGNRYDALRSWLDAYSAGPLLPLDHFFGRLFDEVLSRPGYLFRYDRDSAAVTAHLMDSSRKFRQTVGDEEPFTSGSFLTMVEQGVVAAQYLPAAVEEPDAVLLAPAYTFAMGNRPVEVQFWLNLSSAAWGRRLYQPLTHPYVLSRRWPPGAVWTDGHEEEANRRTLYRLALALIRRCRRLIYLVDSTYNERGLEERGPLQQALSRTVRRAAQVHGALPTEAEEGDGV